MMLNSEQIKEREVLKLDNSKGKAAQIGYDLSVKEIKGLRGVGMVFGNNTQLPTYNLLSLESVINVKEGVGVEGWLLQPGYYEVTFWEGCKIPSNLVGLIRQRSSMLRNGTLLHSSVFDPGFETEEMGSFIAVFHPIFIEVNARLAQIYFHECTPVDKLYGGKDSQFQFDNQRTH